MKELSLAGIDGQHLWGFLTAIGVLSLLDEHARDSRLDAPRLAFKEDGTAVLQSPVTSAQLPAVLLAMLRSWETCLTGRLRSVDKPSDFTMTSYEAIALEAASRRDLDLLAGLACVVGKDAFESTLCAANGASHQSLVQSMRDVVKLVEEEHLKLALFEAWQRKYQVPKEKRKDLKLGARKPTLRLDPSDERLYALRFSNPTTTADYSTELGAQALAIPAFSLLPVAPGKRPVTVASQRSRNRVTFTWPLWSRPITLWTMRSLLWTGVDHPGEGQERGVFAAFSADRVSGAKGKLSFAPSKGVWWLEAQ